VQSSPGEKGSIVFVFFPEEDKCKCRTGELKRHISAGVVSGPLDCTPKYEEPTQEEEDKQDMAHIPMQELEVCTKSPQVKTVEELQENHGEWMQNCYKNASKAVATNFNPFFKRFAKLVDRLAWKAGCGPHPDIADTEDYNAISDQFNFKSFSECDWSKSQNPENDEWMPDRERSRGWTGTSKVVFDDHAKLKMQYPLPLWLQRRKSMLTCLKMISTNGESIDEAETVSGDLAGMMNAVNLKDPGQAPESMGSIELDDTLQGKETDEDPQTNTENMNGLSGDTGGSAQPDDDAEDKPSAFEGSTLD
jgi:hypothetical protein